MPKRNFSLWEGNPLLDIASFGRSGPHGEIGRLNSAQIEHIRLTVWRAPEVMVKVLPRASNDLKAVGKHIDYIGRKGALELESDDGELLGGRIGNDLLNDWDLDIDDVRRQTDLSAKGGSNPPKLVHKLMFSMPPGTSPDKVLGAVRNFAREEFWGQHRYAFVLHIDEAHPHVHLVLKAIDEQGVRLNIKKATLRHWRSEFARNLRLLGVDANATERALRGEMCKAKKDGIYRAIRRGVSTYDQTQTDAVAAERFGVRADRPAEPGKHALVETRRRIESGWQAVAESLTKSGHIDLARNIQLFVQRMQPPRTEKELIELRLIERTRVLARKQSMSR
jgi:Relaxase/Mobilisation nuclease domain